MKLFLTGGTGFIGSHFINQAHSAGHEILALRKLPTSVPRIALERDPIWLDSTYSDVNKYQMSGCDAVIHLAAHSVAFPNDTLESCLHWNVIAPLSLFRTAISAGVDRFIVAGSCFEYGLSGDRYEYIPVDAPLLPTHSYSASKAAASIAFSQLAIQFQLRLSIHRIFQVYGEGESENRFWPSLRVAAQSGLDFAMTSGEQVRDFVTVEMVAKKLLDAMQLSNIKKGTPLIQNIGSGNAKSLLDFAKENWNAFGATGKLIVGGLPQRFGEVLRYVPAL